MTRSTEPRRTLRQGRTFTTLPLIALELRAASFWKACVLTSRSRKVFAPCQALRPRRRMSPMPAGNVSNAVCGNCPESSQLIMKYYQGDKQARIEARRDLATRLGIPLNALRIRAHRIRVHLEGCVEQCTKRLLAGRNELAEFSL